MPAERPWPVAVLAGAMCLLSVATSAQDDADLPDEALLEFLGTWEDAQGNWLDPLTFDSHAKAEPQAPSRDAGDLRFDDKPEQTLQPGDDHGQTDELRADDEADAYDADVESNANDTGDRATHAEKAEHDRA